MYIYIRVYDKRYNIILMGPMAQTKRFFTRHSIILRNFFF